MTDATLIQSIIGLKTSKHLIYVQFYDVFFYCPCGI